MPDLRFTPGDLELFAAASHDRNPLHLAPGYARKTPWGEPVVFGVLGALAALGAASPDPRRAVSDISLTFRNPLLCHVDYHVVVNGQRAGQIQIKVEDAGRVMLTGTFKYRESVSATDSPAGSSAASVTVAEHRVASDLQPATAVDGTYGADAQALRKLIDRWQLADKGLTPDQIAGLMWCSYLVGMRLPGERALFSQLRLQFESASCHAAGPFSYAARVESFDPRFDLIDVAGELTCRETLFARAQLSAFVRRDAPGVALDSLTALLPRSSSLAGKTALIIGGSRGLGAALVAALVTQGCDVLLNYRASEAEAARLRDELAGESGQISLAPGDAGDVNWCRALRDQLVAEGCALDFVICNASPPIRNLGMALESIERIQSFVGESLMLACVPIAGFRESLEARGGTIVVISSAVASTDQTAYPPDWFHYVAAKFSLEGMLRAVAAASKHTHCLIVRPSRLLTDLTNTPSGREGAQPVEGVAAAVVRRLCETRPDNRLEVLDL